MSQKRGFTGASTTMAATPVPHLGIGPMIYTPPAKVSVSLSDAKPEEWTGDLIAVALYQPEDKDALASLPPSLVALDGALGGAFTSLIESEAFKAGAKSSASALLSGKSIKRIAIVGMGKKEAAGGGGYDALGASLASLATSTKCASMGIVVPGGGGSEISKAVESLMAGLYVDGRYKSRSNPKAPKPLKLEAVHIMGADATASDISRGASIAAGVNLCKDMVNSPPNYMTPQSMADIAVQVAKEHGMKYEILEEKEVRALGMGAYLAVTQGSVLPPKFIHLTYTPKGEIVKKVALVGKGLTFDSGGYNIKAGAGSMIELMKFDMGGAGATIGAAKVIGALAPERVQCHFIVASCENMVSSKAYRPGDILTASNGKTIEVGNTDAEGRLTLADALVFAEKLGVDAIIDSATLTGAIIVALGPEYAAVYSSEDTMAKEILECASATSEKLWHMPLAKEYQEMIESKIADIKNTGGKGGGSITAALFLKEFVEKTPWAHVDLAGPVWSDKSGATGYGVRFLSEWVIRQGKKKE